MFDFIEYSHQNGIKNTEKHVKDLITSKKIDIVFTTHYATDYQLSIEFYADLRKTVKIVFCAWDDESYFDVYGKYYGQVADAVITTDYYTMYGYMRMGIPGLLLMPIFSKEMFFPVEGEKDTEVCFIGGCTQRDRKEYIDFIIKNGIKIETYGNGSKHGFLEWNKFSEILSKSKIALTFNKLDTLDWINKEEPLLNRVRQASFHYVESALVKTFCLAEYSPGIFTIAEIGKEVDVFNSKEELLNKIRYYLSHDVERENIAAAAYKRAIKEYVPEVAVPKLLAELDKTLYSGINKYVLSDEIYINESFKRKTINGLTFTMVVLIKNNKIGYAMEIFVKLFKYGVLVFITGFIGGIGRIVQNMSTKIADKLDRIRINGK
ncbi:MAG: glycosyltransferase [Elusimicrobiota bacterium]